jgi:transposase-like protein
LTVGLRMDTEHNAITEPVRRLEVFTGAGRRRTWRDQDKARIVAEIARSGDSVCAVARRHGLSPQQLFGWRRQLRESVGYRNSKGGTKAHAVFRSLDSKWRVEYRAVIVIPSILLHDACLRFALAEDGELNINAF